ncbi:hypothetical protein Vafri_4943 [Volvox africanus]|uniref:Uncharacterized protein n=1 Tax=Volvox africanus TaxID=51714 RepID=A0A8J4AV20_9CHLO|nr:hypothetical protein Vafri_4943 [Volvox africanus]
MDSGRVTQSNGEGGDPGSAAAHLPPAPRCCSLVQPAAAPPAGRSAAPHWPAPSAAAPPDGGGDPAGGGGQFRVLIWGEETGNMGYGNTTAAIFAAQSPQLGIYEYDMKI